MDREKVRKKLAYIVAQGLVGLKHFLECTTSRGTYIPPSWKEIYHVYHSDAIIKHRVNRMVYYIMKEAVDNRGKNEICQTCKTWDQEGISDERRGVCHNPKVLGYLGDDDDGIYEWEAAETHCGPKFGCIHHVRR